MNNKELLQFFASIPYITVPKCTHELEQCTCWNGDNMYDYCYQLLVHLLLKYDNDERVMIEYYNILPEKYGPSGAQMHYAKKMKRRLTT